MSKDGAAEALNTIIRTLAPLDQGSRERVLSSVFAFFNFDLPSGTKEPPTPFIVTASRPEFSDEQKPTPKEFLFQKQPKTDVERIACLAFYLTHFRDTPFFKTVDLAKLNTEAAQIKFSNAAYAANNATQSGYLAPAPKGQKQITAAGEQFVAALPDRDAALQAIARARRRKMPRTKKRT
jgi:hypothetical protein